MCKRINKYTIYVIRIYWCGRGIKKNDQHHNIGTEMRPCSKLNMKHSLIWTCFQLHGMLFSKMYGCCVCVRVRMKKKHLKRIFLLFLEKWKRRERKWIYSVHTTQTWIYQISNVVNAITWNRSEWPEYTRTSAYSAIKFHGIFYGVRFLLLLLRFLIKYLILWFALMDPHFPGDFFHSVAVGISINFAGNLTEFNSLPLQAKRYSRKFFGR